MSDAIKFDIPKSELITKVWDYVRQMETQQTNKWCSCEWIVHPEDVNISESLCRLCGQDRDYITHKDTRINIGPTLDAMHDNYVTNPNQHTFAGRRQRRGEPDMYCPVHTKEGFILGFFEWFITGTVGADSTSIQFDNTSPNIPRATLLDFFPNRGD